MNIETKTCQNCKKSFNIEPEDFEFYEKIKVPPPTFCPDCRLKRRLIWRNERALFKRKCDATGKEIFSMFHPDAQVRVYDRDYWWSDSWDATDYGREYDFNRPFFEQFKELIRDVPWFSRSVNDTVNSDYCMNAGWLKNCYLLFSAAYNENCNYSVDLDNSRECADLFFCSYCELCYTSCGCSNCYKVFYSVDCRNCQETFYSKNCTNCSNIFGCVNLNNKQYCIFNQQYSAEEYKNKLLELNPFSYENLDDNAEKFKEFAYRFPVRSMHGRQNVNVSGDHLNNSKNVSNSYYCGSLEDSRFCQFLLTPPGSRDCYDFTVFGTNSELVYENCQSGIDVSRLKFCAYMYPASHDAEYSITSPSSSYIFGCAGLKRKQYCILNKQYSKEEYEALVPKIIQQMNNMPYIDAQKREYRYGEFFPMELSPFAYNETLIYDLFPLSPNEVTSKGYIWREQTKKTYSITKLANDLPDKITDTDDSIVNEVISCLHQGDCPHNCVSAFRITSQELDLLRRFNLPLPRLCFACRHSERLSYRNPLKLWHRQCQCGGLTSTNSVYQNTVSHTHGVNQCQNTFETSYAPDQPEIIYCESCYQQEVA
ncbi:MAG: hypothetical protein WC764_01665 [Candidatus Paceibacterota bacterium]|jgi:hypothetical protein